MLRLGDKIRLTTKEAAEFIEATGFNNPPRTVQAYNLCWEKVIEYWRSLRCPEGDLMAAILEERLLPDIESEEFSSVIDQENFSQ
jgi:hypothetical protein